MLGVAVCGSFWFWVLGLAGLEVFLGPLGNVLGRNVASLGCLGASEDRKC